MKTRGFITIATGSEQYFRIAANLVKSYRYFTKNPLPFAIITDKENHVTDLFDKVIIVHNATHSYLDKFLMNGNLPFDENIFIEADCLIYNDINGLFDAFADASDISCPGRVINFDENEVGWFDETLLPSIDSQGKDIKAKIKYRISLHGGILFLRNNTSTSNTFFSTAKEIISHHAIYAPAFLQGCFRSISDEPIIALSMALNNCHPIKFQYLNFSVYPNDRHNTHYNIYHGKCYNTSTNDNRCLVHWGTSWTFTPIYDREEIRLNMLINKARFIKRLTTEIVCLYKVRIFWLKALCSNTMDRLQEIKWLRKIWHTIKIKQNQLI